MSARLPSTRILLLLAGAVALLILASTACVPPGQANGGLGGRLTIDGSSTVYPITEAMAEEFRAVAPRVRVTIGVSGTGGGFSRFCSGETDISNASRVIGEDEIEACRANGIEFIELPVAYDGLAIVVNPNNDWVDCLTVQELNTIWATESQGVVTRWNQVRPDFPDRPLVLYGPGTDSGTYDYFVEVISNGDSRGDYQASEDDNVLVQGVSTDVNALGFFGIAYYEENAGRLKLVAVDDEDPTNGDGCITPSRETVRDGTYRPLSRPVFIYVNRASADREEVQAFVRFYLDPDNALAYVDEVGYIAFPPEVYRTVQQRFDERITGSAFASAPPSAPVEEVLGQQ